MLIDRLEARLGLEQGQLWALEKRRGPWYTQVLLPSRQPSWRPVAKAKRRWVSKPCDELKVVQRAIQRLVSARFEPHPIAHAYVPGRGIGTNAREHIRKQWLLHVDLVNFFGSITDDMVFKALRKVLPNYSWWEIAALTSLCCYKRALPQGAPSSPLLSNLVCFGFDVKLHELGSLLGSSVSRYSDDIYFSSTRNSIPQELASIRECGATREVVIGSALNSLVDMFGFEINQRKTKVQDRTMQQNVTGQVVNDGVGLPRECYRYIRGSLRLWERHGLDVAARCYQPEVPIERFVASLQGLIAYYGQVTGRGDKRYRHFRDTYQRLINERRADHQASVAAASETMPLDNVINHRAKPAVGPLQHASALHER